MGVLIGLASVVMVFIFLSVGAWSGARASAAKAQARYALLAKAAEQNTESAKLVLDFLREDEAKTASAKAARSRRDTIRAGVLIMLVGICASILMFYALPGEHERVWPTGLFLTLFGLAGVVMGYFNKPKAT